MFGKNINIDKSYLLLSVHKRGVEYCGSYYSDNNGTETITSINTGEVFYNLKNFVESIYGFDTEDEWRDCRYFNEDKSSWASLYSLMDDI